MSRPVRARLGKERALEAMTAGTPPHARDAVDRRAVVCVAEDALRLHVVRASEDAGFEVLAVVDRGVELLPAVVDVGPDLVVLDISLVGTLGMRLLQLLKMLTPKAAIVALTPFETIDVAVLEAGARAVVPVDDIPQLRAVLRELAVASTS